MASTEDKISGAMNRSRRERLSKAARLGFGPLVDLGIVAARGSEEDTDRRYDQQQQAARQGAGGHLPLRAPAQAEPRDEEEDVNGFLAPKRPIARKVNMAPVAPAATKLELKISSASATAAASSGARPKAATTRGRNVNDELLPTGDAGKEGEEREDGEDSAKERGRIKKKANDEDEESAEEMRRSKRKAKIEDEESAEETRRSSRKAQAEDQDSSDERRARRRSKKKAKKAKKARATSSSEDDDAAAYRAPTYQWLDEDEDSDFEKPKKRSRSSSQKLKKKEDRRTRHGDRGHGKDRKHDRDSSDEGSKSDKSEDGRSRAQMCGRLNNNGHTTRGDVQRKVVGQMTDRELDRKLQQLQAAQQGAKLMTEAEVMAKLQRGRKL